MADWRWYRVCLWTVSVYLTSNISLITFRCFEMYLCLWIDIYIYYSIIVHTHFVTSVSKQHFRTPFPPAPFLDRTPSRSTPATRTRLGQSWSAPESFQRRLSKCAMCQDQPRLDKEALGSRIWEIFMTSWYFMPVWVRIQKHWWHRRSRLMTVRIYKHLWL